MAGLVMMPNNVKNVRQEPNRIVFALNDNSRFVIEYNTLISYDKHLSGHVDVYDWFEVKSGSKTLLQQLLDDKEDLVNKVVFYDSRRKGNIGKGRKDLISVSRFKENELLDYECSESYVRLKT